jgi:spore coat protein U-like protein
MHALIARTAPIAVLALSLTCAPPAAAQEQAAACGITVLELSFGEYDVFAASRTRAVARVKVDCGGRTTKIRPTIELSAGMSQDFGRRTQVSGSNALVYNIYADQALTQIVGDGSSGTTVLFPELVGGSGGTVSSVDLYGAIEPRQFVPPGSYFDTVYVTLTF